MRTVDKGSFLTVSLVIGSKIDPAPGHGAFETGLKFAYSISFGRAVAWVRTEWFEGCNEDNREMR